MHSQRAAQTSEDPHERAPLIPSHSNDSTHAPKLLGTVAEEEHTLAQYRALRLELESRSKFQNKQQEEEKEKEKAKLEAQKYKKSKKLAFLIFLGLSLTQDGIGCFLGVQAVLSILPAIINPINYAICAFFTLINMALFYSFEAGMLKQLFDIDSVVETTKPVIDILDEQIDEAKKINTLLLDSSVIKTIGIEEYKKHSAFAMQMNKDIISKKPALEHHSTSNKKKIMQWAISGFGALMMVAGTLFETKALLAILCAPLLGTPVGWAIIAVTMLSSLVLYSAMRGKGMASLMNPDLHKFNLVKDKMNSFVAREEADFQDVIQDKTERQQMAAALRHRAQERKSEPQDGVVFAAANSPLMANTVFGGAQQKIPPVPAPAPAVELVANARQFG